MDNRTGRESIINESNHDLESFFLWFVIRIRIIFEINKWFVIRYSIHFLISCKWVEYFLNQTFYPLWSHFISSGAGLFVPEWGYSALKPFCTIRIWFEIDSNPFHIDWFRIINIQQFVIRDLNPKKDCMICDLICFLMIRVHSWSQRLN